MYKKISFLVVLALCSLAATAAGADGKWLRGNLHTHSLWSDGDDFPEMIAQLYRDNGYDFLALSDHNILSDHERWMPLREVTRRKI
jgi:hypothetical protein